MYKFEVKILKDSSEALTYDTPGIPLYIQTRNLEDYVNMSSFPHWHSDIEIIYIQSGKLDFHINEKTFTLYAGDCCLLNSKTMHYSRSVKRQNCTFTSILFHPSLLTGNSVLWDKYVFTAIKNEDFTYFHYTKEHPFHSTLAVFIQKMTSLKTNQSYGHEIKLLSCLLDFWLNFITYHNLTDTTTKSTSSYQDMLSFIHLHYMEKISLEDIAAAGNVCRSKCCQLFRENLGNSPIDFLNQYRLEISLKLLEDSNLSITQIASYCGFSTNSYYTHLFHKKYGYTPGEYRTRGCL